MSICAAGGQGVVAIVERAQVSYGFSLTPAQQDLVERTHAFVA